jgi:hypothetical protein
MYIGLQCKIAVILARKSVQWEPSCSVRKDGQKDNHDEVNNHLPQFPERVEKPIKMKILGFNLLIVYNGDNAGTAI